MTKSDLQSQKEQDTWIGDLLASAQDKLISDKTIDSVGYFEYDRNSFQFTKDQRVFEISIKEKKPRKQKVNATKI